MDIQVILKDFGLSEKEIAVYLAVVELGKGSAREIAIKSAVNRGTTYDILKSLIQLGIVSYFNKETKQYFVAEQPEKLLLAIDQKKEDLSEVRKNIEKSLPFIKTLFEKQGGKPTVMLYEGVKGVRTILQDVLESMIQTKQKIYYVYSSAELSQNVRLAFPDFSAERVKKKIAVQTISFGKGGHLNGLDARKFIPLAKKETRDTYEIIYAGKVAHISLDDSENPVGVVIQNQAIYHTQKMIFEFNWSKL